MEPTFEKLLAQLADHAVEFILVGGVAVSMHGYVRLTEDMDILVEDSRENISRFLHVLSEYGEGNARELSLDDFTAEEGAIRIIETSEHLQLDVFTRLSGHTYADLSKDADTFHFSDRSVLYASKRALIALKEQSGTDKDKQDVLALKKLEADPHAFD